LCDYSTVEATGILYIEGAVLSAQVTADCTP